MLTTKKKTHTILKFKQEQFWKPYIEPNTDLQREPEKEGGTIQKTS